MDRLAPGHHVFAPDSLGAGRSPPWPAERVVMLGDEVALLEVPVLYMVGSKSPASSRGVARLLTGVLPDVAVVELAGLGHMGPVTHPEVVNDRIADFLAAH